MSWESLEAIAAVVAAVVAVIAIWLQNKGFRANLTADLIMKLDDRFSLPEYKAIRARAARALLAPTSLLKIPSQCLIPRDVFYCACSYRKLQMILTVIPF